MVKQCLSSVKARRLEVSFELPGIYGSTGQVKECLRRKSHGARQFDGNLAPAPGPALRYWFVMPIEDLQQAAQKIAGFINTLNKLGGMKLKFRITAGDGAKDPAGSWAGRTRHC